MGLLTSDDCGRIHAAALEVLWDVGVRVDDKGIIQMLQEAGGVVENDSVVRIPPELVEWALERCPNVARYANRQGDDWQLGPDGDTMVVTGNALYITRSRKRTELVSADLVELTRVVDACQHIHGMVGTAITDYPPAARDFVGFRIMATHTRKHIRPCIYSPRGSKLIVEMAQVLLDGTPLRDQPIVSTGFSIISPLHWSAMALGVFQETAGYDIPVMVNSEPLGGGTAPVTLAGCLVLGDADTLSGIIINQLLEPGRPCVYNIGFGHVLDMASAIALTGSPENALLQAAGAEMARFHRLPSASWMSTESMLPDAQAAFEKMITGLAHITAGVNLIWGAGNLESTLTMSPLSLIIDNEISGYIMRFGRGITVNDDTLALDVIKEVGLSGDFMTTNHTIQHFRQELSRSELVTRTRRAIWEEHGAKSLEDVAQERLREILDSDPQVYLNADQEKELARIERTGLATVI